MRGKLFLCVFLAVALSLPGYVVAGSDEETLSGISWTKIGMVQDLGLPGDPDDSRADSGSVMVDGGVYKVWYSGYDGSSWRIMHSTSADGVTWNKQGVVYNVGPPGAFDDSSVMGPCVLKKDDGTYQMWYHAESSSMWGWRIGYATSNDGKNWVRYGLVFSKPNDSVAHPNVMIDDSGVYRMWFSQYDRTHWRIGQAVSNDGISWTDLGVVLDVGAPGQPDSKYVYFPAVMVEPDGTYLMFYCHFGGVGNFLDIQYATSPDGRGATWTKRGMSLEHGQVGDYDEQQAIPTTIRLRDDGRHELYYTGYDGHNRRMMLAREYRLIPPVADLGDDRTILEGDAVILDASSSFDPDGEIVKYEFDFGDGTSLVLQSNTPTDGTLTNHADGLKHLDYTLPEGKWNELPVPIGVEEKGPGINRRPFDSELVGSAMPQDKSEMFQEDVQPVVEHIYGDDGIGTDGFYTVTLTVTDNDGLTATTSIVVTVENVPPAIDSLSSFTMIVNAPRTVGYWGHQCTVVEPYGDQTGILQNWVDEISSQSAVFQVSSVSDVCEIVQSGDSSEMVVMAKRQLMGLWLNIASGKLHPSTELYMPSLTSSLTLEEAVQEIEDAILNSIDREELERVKDMADSVNNGQDISMVLVEFTATISDPGSDDTTITWDFGDGSPPWTSTYYNNAPLNTADPYPSPDVNPVLISEFVQHWYALAGTYDVELTVHDDDGGSVTSTLTLQTEDCVVCHSTDVRSPLANAFSPLDDSMDERSYTAPIIGPTDMLMVNREGVAHDLEWEQATDPLLSSRNAGIPWYDVDRSVRFKPPWELYPSLK